VNDELIHRNKLLEELSGLTAYITGMRSGKGVLHEYAKQYRDSLLRIIDEQTAVDAVEVVRCRDCRLSMMWRKPADKVIGECMIRKMYSDDEWFYTVAEDGFCSDGKRREDNG